MQLPPMTARPPSMRMLPRGQSVAHWPQPTHASLTANFCALPATIFGQTLLSSWLRGFFGGALGEDVLALLCDRGFQAVFTEYNALPPAQRGSLAKAVFQYWFRSSAVLEALVQIHRTDILFDSLRRSSGLIEALQPLADDPARFDYFVAIITSSMIGVLTVWVEHGKTEAEDQMVQKLTSAFIEMAILELPG